MTRTTSTRFAAAFAAVSLLALLTACDPGATPGPAADGSPEPTATTAAPTPDPGGSTTPDPEPDPEPAPDPAPDPTLSAADRQNVEDAVRSENYAAVEGYLSDRVVFVIMASECCGGLSAAEAAAQLGYIAGAPGPWNFDLPAATVAGWRGNYYYGSLFTGDDIVGRAADGTIVSFGIEGARITSILVGFEEGFSH